MNPNKQDAFAAPTFTMKSSAVGSEERYQLNTQASGTHILPPLFETSEEFKELIRERSPASANSAIGQYDDGTMTVNGNRGKSKEGSR